FSHGKNPKIRRNAIISAGVGLAAALAAFTVIGRRDRSAIADYYLAEGPVVTGGSNVVNVILVEIRALDTFGEITVLGLAGEGIEAVLRAIPRRYLDPQPDPSPGSPFAYVARPFVGLGVEGSRADDALEDAGANTGGLRLLQKALLPILGLVSAMLFFRGHNQ